MSSNDIVKPLLMKDHIQRGAESIQHLARRGVRPVSPCLVELEVVTPVEEHAGRLGVLRSFQRFRACAHNSQPGGKSQRFLRSSERYVHLPVVHTEINGANR